jgi:hypothetical protein
MKKKVFEYCNDPIPFDNHFIANLCSSKLGHGYTHRTDLHAV